MKEKDYKEKLKEWIEKDKERKIRCEMRERRKKKRLLMRKMLYWRGIRMNLIRRLNKWKISLNMKEIKMIGNNGRKKWIQVWDISRRFKRLKIKLISKYKD